MKSILNNVKSEYIINKSRFISFLFRVSNIDEINKYLNDIRLKYKDSTHVCYSYILPDSKRFNDDGEPGGTAGMPILNVLESNDLNYILCVVVRYFGGIKLGAGGLVRAYTKSVTKSLNDAVIKNLVDGYKLTISFSYDQVKGIDNMLSKCEITDKKYDDNIYYTFLIKEEDLNIIESKLNIINKEKILITD